MLLALIIALKLSTIQCNNDPKEAHMEHVGIQCQSGFIIRGLNRTSYYTTAGVRELLFANLHMELRKFERDFKDNVSLDLPYYLIDGVQCLVDEYLPEPEDIDISELRRFWRNYIIFMEAIREHGRLMPEIAVPKEFIESTLQHRCVTRGDFMILYEIRNIVDSYREIVHRAFDGDYYSAS